MSKEILITPEYLENKIYNIKGQKVMLDSDLAEIYGYTTKAFNQQIQRNKEKFEEDFMFKVEDDDLAILRSQFVTSRLDIGADNRSKILTGSIRSQNATGCSSSKEDSIRCKNSTGQPYLNNSNLRSQKSTSSSLKNEDILRCQNVTSSWGGSRYPHYVFTEQGIYMLMTVLKGDLAIK